MTYQLYRNTTLGNTLQETLDDLLQYGQITPQLAFKALVQFDKAMNAALSNKTRTRTTFKANKLLTYRFCDNVWTLLFNDITFRDNNDYSTIVIECVKVVACDGKPGTELDRFA